MPEGLRTWDPGEGQEEDGVTLVEEGVFNFYLGELGARAWLTAHPDLHTSEDAQALAMIYEVGASPSTAKPTATPRGLRPSWSGF